MPKSWPKGLCAGLAEPAGLPVETTGAYAWPRLATSSTKSCARTGPGWSNASFASSLRMRARRASAGAGAGTGAGSREADQRRAASEPTQAACPAPPVDRGPDLHGAGGLAARDAPHPAAHDAAAAVAASANRGRRRRAPAGRPREAFPSARCAGEPVRGCQAGAGLL